VRPRAPGELQDGDRAGAPPRPAAQLHQGPQGDLCQRESKPQEGEEACDQGMVLQTLRPEVALHPPRPRTVLLKLSSVLYRAW